ncbi:thiamine-phosphate kinase [Arcobacter sp. FWKO B]|uniref:thiamine-phosphate kinase n=1 Tax=Arcobacter sp. FWKO B TaxID=2593672 RepID=UPI0018A39EA5|nr:thiamine-phosphate kinase [Arcobacter sp. FWKO B]QOG11554.1 thiamine-phosphate kinase [Arcobacter sp. FWKO B]
MNKEAFFIKQFVSATKHIGDDGAVVGKWVYSQDAFFENVHFKKEWMSLEQIATKAMLVNISDAIVMNAKPKYALLTVAIPKIYTQSDLISLARGFKKTAKKFGVEIIGGDTISNEKLDISVTIISKTKKPILRTGAKIGDLVAYTGELGSAKKDLDILLGGGNITKKSKFIKPKLNPEFFYEISPYISSALDISDGLFFELGRLSSANNIGFEFFESIDDEIGCSGEEYEVLFSFDVKHFKKIDKIAKKHKVDITVFAKAVDGSFECPCKEHHF